MFSPQKVYLHIPFVEKVLEEIFHINIGRELIKTRTMGSSVKGTETQEIYRNS